MTTKAEVARAEAAARAASLRQLDVLMLGVSVPVLVLSWAGLAHFAEKQAGFSQGWALLWPAMFEVAAVMLARVATYMTRIGHKDEARGCERFAVVLVVLSVVAQMAQRTAETTWSADDPRGTVLAVAGVLAHAVAPVVLYGLWRVNQRAHQLTPVVADAQASTATRATSKAASPSASKAVKTTRAPAAVSSNSQQDGGKPTNSPVAPADVKPRTTRAPRAPRPQREPATRPVVVSGGEPVHLLEDERVHASA